MKTSFAVAMLLASVTAVDLQQLESYSVADYEPEEFELNDEVLVEVEDTDAIVPEQETADEPTPD